MAKLWLLRLPAHSAFFLWWSLSLSFYWQGAHAWISTTTTTTTTFAPFAVLLHQLNRHHHQHKLQQPFRIQPISTNTTSSDTSSSSISSNPSSASSSSPSSSSSFSPLEYNWKDVPNPSKSAEVVPAAVFGQPLVLWREPNDNKDDDDDDSSSTIYCATDVCPHRSTALSEGRVRNGTLSCLYHAWQFSGRLNGKCVRIPQLES